MVVTQRPTQGGRIRFAPKRCGPRSSTPQATSGSEDLPGRGRARRGGDPRHADDDLRHRRPHPQGRVPGQAGPDRGPRAGRRHRGARARASTGYEVGDRVLVGAITPCGQCHACLQRQARRSAATAPATRRSAAGASATPSTARRPSTCSCRTRRPTWPRSPTTLTDEQVVLLADIASTGFSGAESGGVKIGDTVVVFAQGPIGLCATAGAKLMGAARVIGVDGDPNRGWRWRSGWAPTSCSIRPRSTWSRRSSA